MHLKLLLVWLSIFILPHCMHSQKIFKVQKTSRQFDFPNEGNNSENSRNLYRIVFEDTKVNFANYPIQLANNMDPNAAIQELLKFEGDNRLCSFPAMNYSTITSKIYDASKSDYSIQVEALFLINQIIFEKPFNYSPIPVLMEVGSQKTSSLDGEIVKKAFVSYKSWFEANKSISQKINQNMMADPLKGSGIKWF